LFPLFRATLAAVSLRERTDGELLARFVAHRDEDAFAELVRRLGPTVFGTCRSVLSNTEDAEDAFQVTFLILARKAATIRPVEHVGAWVHGVALLAARKARASRVRRAACESDLGGALAPIAPRAAAEPDLAGVVHEELDRLPNKYRVPIVLCDFRELTIAQAAAELGWVGGTVASRLSRGRALLAIRLRRRGLGAAAAAAALTRGATAVPPARLICVSVSAAGVGGAVPPDPPLLLGEVLRVMRAIQVRTFCLKLFVAAAVALSSVVVFGSAPAASVPAAKSPGADAHPIDRVKVEDLSALLEIHSVSKDLELTAEQTQKLDDASAKIQATIEDWALETLIDKIDKIENAKKKPQNIEVKDRGSAVVRDAIQVFGREAAAILKPEQMRRLKQIRFQAKGPAALLDRRAIRALGLTADQEDKIDAVVSAVETDPHVGPDGNMVEAVHPKGVEKLDATWAEVLKVLIPEQRAKWDALIGKRLPTPDLCQINRNSSNPDRLIHSTMSKMFSPGKIPPVSRP